MQASALDARAPPARLALASLVMHSYHWGMTASPLALDLFLTMSGAGPHTPWSEWRERSIGLSSLKRGDESDSKFQEILRRNLATTSKALKNANRLSKVIQERLRKRDGAARVARHMGPTVSGRPRRRRKLREALPGPGVPDAAEEEESLLEESLFFDSEEPSPKSRGLGRGASGGGCAATCGICPRLGWNRASFESGTGRCLGAWRRGRARATQSRGGSWLSIGRRQPPL